MAQQSALMAGLESEDDNHPDAQFALGVKCSDERTMAAAARCFRLAAEQGHADAQFRLGSLHAQGHAGAPKDFDEANFWFRVAAANGHQLAAESSAYLEKHVLASSGGGRKLKTFAKYSDVMMGAATRA